MTTLTDRAGLMADVLENPLDDAPRLIFADWCEENGDEARAEFVCAQVELGRRAGCLKGRGRSTLSLCCRVCDLRRREADLLSDSWQRWLHEAFDGLAHDVGISARGDNDFGVGLYDAGAGELGHFDCAFRRGFVGQVGCDLGFWHRRGPAIVRAQPITRVEATDAPTDHVERDPGFAGWFLRGEPALDFLSGSLVYRYYATERAARDALSAACIAWARAQP